jgi:type II secretory pathway component GspD/PulD (secretin)
MKRIIGALIICGALRIAAQGGDAAISSALEDLFGTDQSEAEALEEEPLYLRIIPSRTQQRSTIIYRCRHVVADSIVYSVESATSPTGTVETSDDQNMITINDVNEQIEELKELILALDRRGPQVLVEAQIVEVQMDDGLEQDSAFNFSYYDRDKDVTSTFGSMLGGTKGYSDDNTGGYPEDPGGWVNLFPLNKELSNGDIVKINAKLKWLRTHDKAEILSSPNLLVDLGTTAAVSTGTDQPLLSVSVNNGVSQEEVYYKRTGVDLRVTPLLINNDTVTIEVRPEVTSVVGYATLSSSSEPPIISVRNIETKLNLRDGGVVMMGGLYSSKDIESEQKVPFLGDIPLLGYLFRSKNSNQQQVQLVFLLRVSIVPDNSLRLLNNMDKTKEEVLGVGDILGEELAPEPAPFAEE